MTERFIHMTILNPTQIKVFPWATGTIAVYGSYLLTRGTLYTIQSTDDGINWHDTGTTKQNGTGTTTWSMLLATEVLAPFSRLVVL